MDTMKVTRGQIEKALEATGGTVARAAEILGIARKNLYIRMAHMGIQPDAYRRNTPPSVTVTRTVTQRRGTDATRNGGATSARGAVSVFPNDTLESARGGRNVSLVSSATTAEPVGQEDVKKLRQPRSLYLRPDQWKEVDDACFDLAAKHREKQSPSRIEERFHDRYFAKFVAEELSAGKSGQKKGGAK